MFYVACSDCVWYLRMLVVYWPLLKIVFKQWVYMVYVCVRDVMDVVLSV